MEEMFFKCYSSLVYLKETVAFAKFWTVMNDLVLGVFCFRFDEHDSLFEIISCFTTLDGNALRVLIACFQTLECKVCFSTQQFMDGNV